MADTEKKVRSIRADDETFQKFRTLCEEWGGQSEAFNALISAYELAQAKKLLSGQADSISDFQAKGIFFGRFFIVLLFKLDISFILIKNC